MARIRFDRTRFDRTRRRPDLKLLEDSRAASEKPDVRKFNNCQSPKQKSVEPEGVRVQPGRQKVTFQEPEMSSTNPTGSLT